MLRVVTYNVNREGTPPGYEAYSWEARKAFVFARLLEYNADILILQEVEFNAVHELWQAIPGFAWHVSTEDSHTSMLVTGVKESLSGSWTYTGPKNSLWVYCNDLDTWIVNVHLRHTAADRFASGTAISALVAKFKGSRTGNELPVQKWIIAGDFNSFPDARGEEQIAQLSHTSNTYEASAYARYKTDNKPALKSFKHYPYDPVPPEVAALPGKLDHILVFGFVSRSAVVDDRNIPGYDWAPSDHYPVIVELKPSIAQ